MLVLSGCPVALNFSPAEPATEKINKKLIGTWRFQPDEGKESEVTEVTFERVDGSTLKAFVKEKGSMYSVDTDVFLGYETDIEGLHVLFFKPEAGNEFYLYQYKMDDDNTLIVADVSLLVGGVDAVTSTEALRAEIKGSISKSDFYKEPKTYKRVK
jgi:hypothetical protein